MAHNVMVATNELDGVYKKLALLSTSDDMNAASFHGEEIRYSRFSLPWNFDALSLSDRHSLELQVKANWFEVRGVESIVFNDNGMSFITPSWSVKSLVGGGKISSAINKSLTWNYGGNVGLLRLKSHHLLSEHLSQEGYAALKNFGFLGVTNDLIQLSPSTGMKYMHRRTNDDVLTLDGRVSWHVLFPIKGEGSRINTDTGTWYLVFVYGIPFRSCFSYSDISCRFIVIGTIRWILGQRVS
ncbi:hypothetical protein [Enterobacter cloacae]|uniref:hypothetical protein n=1 Tax=Enterobacter cloacae TaxID=550 RepID=UPI002B1EE3D6|nr:hypothetical protein [Enterobacter cloacae]MEA5217528.1 hypothetical protein [Enterobacter cloacae]